MRMDDGFCLLRKEALMGILDAFMRVLVGF